MNLQLHQLLDRRLLTQDARSTLHRVKLGLEHWTSRLLLKELSMCCKSEKITIIVDRLKRVTYKVFKIINHNLETRECNSASLLSSIWTMS